MDPLQSPAPSTDTIIFMRHGRTWANEQNLLQGSVNYSLSQNGKIDVELGAKNMYASCISPLISPKIEDNQKAVLVFACSTLNRAIETREIAIQTIKAMPTNMITTVSLSPDPNLQERSYGPYETQPAQNLPEHQKNPPGLDDRIDEDNDWHTPLAEGIETDGHLLARIVPAIILAHEQAKKIISTNPGLLIVCGHGSAWRTLRGAISGDHSDISNGDYILLDIKKLQALHEKLVTLKYI